MKLSRDQPMAEVLFTFRTFRIPINLILIVWCLVWNPPSTICESASTEVEVDYEESTFTQHSDQPSEDIEELEHDQIPVQDHIGHRDEFYQDDPHPEPPAQPPPSFSSAHYALSPIHLTQLASIEESIYSLLSTYEERLEERLNIIRRFRSDYETSVVEFLKDFAGNTDDPKIKASYLMYHPFLNHRMIKRYSTVIKEVYDHILLNSEYEVINNLEEWRGDYLWPSPNDVQESSHVLLRLRAAHDTDILDFLSGRIRDAHTHAGLRAVDTVDLADHALAVNDKLTASELLKAAKVQVQQWGDTSTSVQQIHEFWEWMHSSPMTVETWNIDDLPSSPRDSLTLGKQHRKANYDEKKFVLNVENRIENFQALCRGEIPSRQLTKLKSKVLPKCLTKLTPGPSFTFERVEILSTEPKIFLIHDLFGDETTSEITSGLTNTLMKSLHRDTGKVTGFLENTTASPIWLHEIPSTFVKTLRRIESLLSLNLGQTIGNIFYLDDPVLLTVLGVGGFSEPSLNPEPLFGDEFTSGKIIATVHLILEAPEAGGELAFTQLGLPVKPLKGSAIVFFNSDSNGQSDERLLIRGICPLIVGNKWVASTFFRENSNFLNLFKCSNSKRKLQD